jgi:hypothetical protein
MKLLEQVQRGVISAPRRTLLHGTHGIGKSPWGAMADAPIFIQTEDGLAGIGCERFPLATRYADVIAELSELYTQPHEHHTVVIDSLDWLERLIGADVCQKRGVENMEDSPRLSRRPHRRRERCPARRGPDAVT